MFELKRLDGRVAVVAAGAGRGIGAAITHAFALEGAYVVVSDASIAMDGSGHRRQPSRDRHGGD